MTYLMTKNIKNVITILLLKLNNYIITVNILLQS